MKLPLIPRDVTPWFTALRAYSKLQLVKLAAVYDTTGVYLFGQAFHCTDINECLFDGGREQILPRRERGEGEGVSIRHGGLI